MKKIISTIKYSIFQIRYIMIVILLKRNNKSLYSKKTIGGFIISHNRKKSNSYLCVNPREIRVFLSLPFILLTSLMLLLF